MVKMNRKRKVTQVEDSLSESLETITVSASESESAAKSDVEEIELEPTLTEAPGKDDVAIVDDKVILVLDTTRPVHFKGSLRVRVLHGVVDILGARLTPSDGDKDVFSPRGYSLLCFSATAGQSTASAPVLTEALRQSLIDAGVKSSEVRTKLTTLAEQGSALVLLSKLEVDTNSFVSKHLVHSIGGNFQLFGRDSTSTSSGTSGSLSEAEKVLDVSFFAGNSGQV